MEKTTRPPDFLIGDMDSIDPLLWDKLRDNGKTKIIKISEQDTTDFEKALNFISTQLNIQRIIALNAFGGRIDHTLANLNILVKYPQLQITLMNESCTASVSREVNSHLISSFHLCRNASKYQRNAWESHVRYCRFLGQLISPHLDSNMKLTVNWLLDLPLVYLMK